MIGFIISEGVELVYSILKITYNASYGIYSWYYDENKIEKLENRIEELEKKIENS
tara:strand:- start:636 stop:800 length:165 start_codon:yes stop_codon:yes gene_type:complete